MQEGNRPREQYCQKVEEQHLGHITPQAVFTQRTFIEGLPLNAIIGEPKKMEEIIPSFQ